ncbi:MAG: hypothetical protein NTW21_09000 [Verrucomicrobia bacterium]|nr:hypothetical protein [Verrucomicrobiota bacterium]
MKTRSIRLIALVPVLGCHAGHGAGLPKPVSDYRSVVKSADLATYSRAAMALRKWMIENDPGRPLYHFTGVASGG